MNVGDKISVMLDTESYTGTIQAINADTIDVLTCIGLVCGIPINKTEKTIQEKYDDLCNEITRLQIKYDENGYECSPMIKLQRIEQHIDTTINIYKNPW